MRLQFLALGITCAMMPLTLCYGSIVNNSQLNISGDGIVGAAFLNWICDQPGDTACPVLNAGDFAVVSSTGSFAQYNGTFGISADINNASEPLGGVLALPNFMTFDLNNNETIELTLIPLGTDTVSADCASLSHCTPTNAALITPSDPLGLSAFNLDQNSAGTAATFGVVGTVFDISGDTGSITGVFTAQFAGLTPAEVLEMLGSGGIASTYSANMAVTATAEPAAMGFVGFGLLGMAGFYRRART